VSTSFTIGAGSLDWIGDRRRRLVAGEALLAGVDPATDCWQRENAGPADLARLVRDPGRMVVLIDGGDAAVPLDRLAGLDESSEAWLAFLLAPRAAPHDGTRNDGAVGSLACSPAVYRSAAPRLADGTALAYRLAAAALGQRGLAVYALDGQPPVAPDRDAGAPLTWLIPHRGDPALLDTCLRHVRAEAAADDQVWVCLDEAPSAAHTHLVQAHPGLHFWRVAPAGLGPYVARHILDGGATTELLVFQDSDDLPIPGRRDALVGMLRRTAADMVGSHELRLDEVRGVVTAVRFPLDVNAALTEAVSHPLFHPTSIVRVDALRRAGGFSTARRFGADLQFLLRASFTMRIRNCDAFLYLRRRRPGSLTTSPGTGLGTPDRVAQAQRWREDFARVVGGTLALRESSLMAEHHAELARVRFDYLGAGPPPTRRPPPD
jgi:hypothetical protein